MVEWDSKHQVPESADEEEGSEDAEMGEDEVDEKLGVDEDDEEDSEEADEKGESENNSCISIYFQSDRMNPTEECTLLVLESILEEEAFDASRTK